MSDGDSESGSSTDPTPESAPPDGYTVGYRNPPKEFRFKPGNNANPRGRPKGSRKENVIVKELFLERLPVRDGDGKKSMSKLEIILTKLLNRAISRFDRYRTSQWASLCEYPICLLAVDAKWVRTAPIRGAAGRAEETL